MNLENIMLIEIGQTEKNATCLHLNVESLRKVELIEAEWWKSGGDGEMLVKGTSIQLEEEEVLGI